MQEMLGIVRELPCFLTIESRYNDSRTVILSKACCDIDEQTIAVGYPQITNIPGPLKTLLCPVDEHQSLEFLKKRKLNRLMLYH